MIALALSHLKYVGWLLAVVIACVVLVEHDRHVRDTALLTHELAALHAKERIMADSIKDARKVVFRDTVKLTRLVRDWQTIHDTTVLHLTDTVRVKAALAQADTTIKACRATVADCAALNHLLTDQLAVKDSVITGLSALQPHRVRSAITFGTIGFGSALLLHALGVIR